MPPRLPLPIRVHGSALSLVVTLLTVALLVVSRPLGALGAAVDPVPVGVWPLAPTPEVVRAFDPPESLFGAGHRGVDLAGLPGMPVLAAMAGRITFAGTLAGRGVVVVDHGSTRTTYEPVVAVLRVGQSVQPGQRLGVLELRGSHCPPGACLHWGWRRGDTYLDPLLLVGGGPIRLLPLWGVDPVAPPMPWGMPSAPYDALVARPLQEPTWGIRCQHDLFRRAGGPVGRPVGAGPC